MKDEIIAWIRTQLGERIAVIGLSGGIDSTVVAFLLAQAIGFERVQAYCMPSRTTRIEDVEDAQEVARLLSIPIEVIPIAPLIKTYQDVCDAFQDAHAAANLQSRIRMTLLYGYANAHDALVVGTGNRSELMTGYFTKYGDGGVDLLPIGHLYKTQVWELAAELGVPQKYIDKIPTAGLMHGQTDEAELGMLYEQLDVILQSIEMENTQTLHAASPENVGGDLKKVRRVKKLVAMSAHKRAVPPMISRV